jgi:rSAM/selenodomain-associated transferase 1
MAAYPLTVWYDPPDALQEMREWLGDHEYRVQEGGDLGARMAHAFREHFARGEGPVVVIGADTPHLSATTVADAVRVLDRADVVIGPAFDGGYYLLGLKALHEPLFAGVPWGTSNVLQVTVRQCHDLDLTVGQLGVRRDIDTVDDLRALGM